MSWSIAAQPSASASSSDIPVASASRSLMLWTRRMWSPVSVSFASAPRASAIMPSRSRWATRTAVVRQPSSAVAQMIEEDAGTTATVTKMNARRSAPPSPAHVAGDMTSTGSGPLTRIGTTATMSAPLQAEQEGGKEDRRVGEVMDGFGSPPSPTPPPSGRAGAREQRRPPR